MSERTWYRVMQRAHRAMRYGSRSPLRAAVDEMIREEYGTRIGACDHCDRPAVFRWTRTGAQLKAMRGRKVKGARAEALAVSWRCATHVPVAFPELGECYQDVRATFGRETVAEVA